VQLKANRNNIYADNATHSYSN